MQDRFLIISILVNAILLMVLVTEPFHYLRFVEESPPKTPKYRRKLLHSPRKFFIDFGASGGDNLKYFLMNQSIAQVPDDGPLRGMGMSGDWTVILFEANPTYNDRLNAMKTESLNAGRVKQFDLYNGTAVGTYNGMVEFILDNYEEGSDGSSIMKEKQLNGTHMMVPIVDIVDLFKKHKIDRKDTVVLKVDIEGAEFELMKRMFVEGLMSRIDILAVEYHTIRMLPKYSKISDCLKWMVSDIPGVRVLDWS